MTMNLGNHSTFIATLVAQLAAAAVLGAGLTFYFSYDASHNYWEVPILWAVAIVSLITTSALIAGSAAKSVSCLTLMPCISIVNVLFQIICIVATILMFISNTKTLHFCDKKEVDRTDCEFLFDAKFCGQDILLECVRLKHGFLLLMVGLAMLLVLQIISFFAAFRRRSIVLKTEYTALDSSYNRF